MGDLMLGQDKRLILPPPTDSLIGRLDQIDHRLRQLEEKQQLPESYFIADLQRPSQHHHCNSLPSALHDVQVKGNLMDRLHLLEGRIRQLSFQLDKDSCAASTSAVRPTDNENAWIRPAVADKKQQMSTTICSGRVVGGPWKAAEIFHLHAQKTKSKVKDSKEDFCAAEKGTSTVCRNEKRRMERTRFFRRWFPVGC